MGFFDWFKTKQIDKRNNHKFDELDREISQEYRQKKAELQQLKLERENELHKLRIEREKLMLIDEINELKGMYEEEEEEQPNKTEDVILTAILGAIANKKNNQTETNPTETPSSMNSMQSVGGVSLSNDELQHLWENVPNNYKRIARKMDNASLAAYLKTQLPNANTDSINRAIMIIKET